MELFGENEEIDRLSEQLEVSTEIRLNLRRLNHGLSQVQEIDERSDHFEVVNDGSSGDESSSSSHLRTEAQYYEQRKWDKTLFRTSAEGTEIAADNLSQDFQQSQNDLLISNINDKKSSLEVAADVEKIDNPDVAAVNFAMEHRIFLKAILELLAQRDENATVVGMNDPNILKSGPLKKASHLMSGIWKVKFVEIRRGMLSYYDDAISKDSGRDGKQGKLLRKNIPLEANSCTCRPVKLHQKALNISPGGAIFELTVHGGSRRLWMANSREERHKWIQAVNTAMVGGSVTRGGSHSDVHGKSGFVSSRSPFKSDLRKYLKVQSSIKSAKTKMEYIAALSTLKDNPLNVPVKWIIEQCEDASNSRQVAFQEHEINRSIDQLWKDLKRDTVKINNEIFVGDSGNAPERIIGALVRHIVALGTSGVGKFNLNECQALSYARDVLLSGNRTRSGGDSYFCIDTLCFNQDLVVLVPDSAVVDPLSITVVQDTDHEYDIHAKSGWLGTRKKSQKTWRRRFFVLSEGTLSWFEKAQPRPHGLDGQLKLADASISVTREEPEDGRLHRGYFVVTIATKDGSKDRQLLFDSETRLVVWAYALECTATAKTESEPAPLMNAVKNVFRPKRGNAKGDENSSPKVARISKVESSLKNLVDDIGIDADALESRLANYARRSSSTVKISVQALTKYKICTINPQGDGEDIWATVRATFKQDFRLTGGSNGRIIRGEEIVQVDVAECNCELPTQLDASNDLDTLPNRARKRVFATRKVEP